MHAAISCGVFFLNHVRASNSKPKHPQRKFTRRIIPIRRIIPHASRDADLGRAIARPREHGHGDERANEQEVQQDEQPADEFGSPTTQAELHERDEDGVDDCCGEDALNGAVGGAGTAGQLDELVEAGGEEAERAAWS